MKAVIQRVIRASVHVEGKTVGQIESGLLVLLGVAKGDGEADGRYLVEKIRTFRIFSDEQGKMNRSLEDIGGSVLVVSQFTLLGRTANGRRPSFDEAGASGRSQTIIRAGRGSLTEPRYFRGNRGLRRAHAARVTE